MPLEAIVQFLRVPHQLAVKLIIYLVFRVWHNLSSLPCTETEPETEAETETGPETEPETEPETDTDTDTEPDPEPEPDPETEPSIYVNIRDFGLSTCIRSFVRIIFSVCLSVYFLDVWRFLYFPTHSCDGMMTCQFVLPSSSVLVQHCNLRLPCSIR